MLILTYAAGNPLCKLLHMYTTTCCFFNLQCIAVCIKGCIQYVMNNLLIDWLIEMSWLHMWKCYWLFVWSFSDWYVKPITTIMALWIELFSVWPRSYFWSIVFTYAMSYCNFYMLNWQVKWLALLSNVLKRRPVIFYGSSLKKP